MAKNNLRNNLVDLSAPPDDVDSFYGEEEMVPEILGQLIEASHQQMQIAFCLTQLIADKCLPETITEEKILKIFEHSTKAVSENFHLKGLWDKFS